MARAVHGTRGRGACCWTIFAALLHAAAALPVAGPGSIDVTLLVRSQDTKVDQALLQELRTVVMEAGWPHKSLVSMADAEHSLAHHGLWTYKPWIFLHEKALEKEKRRSAGGQRWIVFLEPNTAVDPQALEAKLSAYDSRTPLYLGRKLVDEGSCIIHHYSQEPPYAHAHAGFALSSGLLRLMVKDLKANPLSGGQQIEPVWELAKWIKDLGVGITDSDAFCGERQAGCATWIRPLPILPAPDKPLATRDVVIAVKTVSHFHKDRVPIIHDLWGASSPMDVLYLSNEAYAGGANTEVLTRSVVNLSPEFGDAVDPKKESTEQGSGHCAKMKAILQYLSKHEPGRQWYVVTDDDTLLDTRRLLEILSLHDSKKAIYLGERYGWAHREKMEGNNYMTTGAGMAMTAPALAEVLRCSHCTCASMSAPDDMTLGSWFTYLPVQMVHDESFHQAEPHNYHPELLKHGAQAVSFHRFDARMPANTPAAKIDKTRRKNWKAWQKLYFKPRQAQVEAGAEL